MKIATTYISKQKSENNNKGEKNQGIQLTDNFINGSQNANNEHDNFYSQVHCL